MLLVVCMGITALASAVWMEGHLRIAIGCRGGNSGDCAIRCRQLATPIACCTGRSVGTPIVTPCRIATLQTQDLSAPAACIAYASPSCSACAQCSLQPKDASCVNSLPAGR